MHLGRRIVAAAGSALVAVAAALSFTPGAVASDLVGHVYVNDNTAGVNTIAVGLITEARQAEDIVASGKADMVALARGVLYDPRWGWHAAAELGGHVDAPPQYWRSQPSTQKALFGATRFGAR